MVNVYMIRSDKYGVGFYSYGPIYYNKDWAQIICDNNMFFDTDQGNVDSHSELLNFDLEQIKDDKVWKLEVYDGDDTLYICLFSTKDETLFALKAWKDKKYSIREVSINIEKPKTYMEIMKDGCE